MRVDFLVLGEVAARAGDRVLDVGHARQRCVLAALLVDVNRVVPADVLLDRVWADRPPRHARNALSGYVSRLRQVLAATGEVRLARQLDGYQLSADPLTVDLHRFAHLVDLARQPSTEDESFGLFQRALGLWQGTAFGSLDTPWLATVRDTLEADRLAAELDRNDVALRLGRQHALLGELAARATAHPLDERLAGQLMLARYRCGQQAAALQHYERIRLSLKEELGADPSPPLRELHQRLLSADPGLSPSLPPPRQLPALPGSFTGRDRELSRLDVISTGVPTLAVVSGPAGVGKTALALRWAHRVAERFADGQLYVNLRGFDPSGSVLGAHDAVRGFLHALDVAPDRIPANLDEATALYRSLLAGRRMLVVLDNAREVEQVRPLLPGEPACAVVVTSRNRLAGLVAGEGAHPVEVGLLTRAEAGQLLADRLGHRRLTAEPDAVAEILTRCAGLPLALAIVAARAVTHPDFPLGVLADELSDSDGLAALAGPDPRTDLRAVLACSYRALSPEAANLFTLLGFHVGPEITTAAAASLAGLPVAEVRPLLAELGDAHLTTQPVPGRHTLHDLVFTYAFELARQTRTRRVATTRVLDHYLHTADLGSRLLLPAWSPIGVTPVCPGVTLEDLGDRTAAMKWFTAQHPALLAAVKLAAGTGLDRHTVQLASAMGLYLSRRARWDDRAAVQRAAVTAAVNLADRPALAEAHRSLAYTVGELGRYDEAHAHLAQALDLFRALDDCDGQARAYLAMSWAFGHQLRATEALEHSQTALRLFRATGNRVGQARALNAIGWCHAQLGHPLGVRYCWRAILAHQEAGDPYGEAASWDSLGYAHHRLGHHGLALTGYQRALAIHRAGDDHADQATVLDHIGDTHVAAGNHAAAQQVWREALTILTDFDIPESDDILDKLGAP